MKALAKEVAAALGFIAIGVAVALAVVFVHDVEASPDPGVSYVLRGMAPLAGQHCASWAGSPYQLSGCQECWHDNESGQYSAIDYNRGAQTAGSHVYLDYEGDFQLFKMLPYSGNCKGVRAAIYWESYDPANYRGDIHYLHIDVNEYWLNKEVPWQLIWIGDVAEEDLDDCPGWVWVEGQWYWPPHLHQSADYSPTTPFYSNKFRDPSQGENWQHAILWEPADDDDDGDDFTNANELYIDTDPFDDCPDTTTANDEYPGPWPPDFNDDRVVDTSDAITFLAHFPSAVNYPSYDARCDLDPNGVIDATDAIIFFNCFPSTCTPY